MNTPGQTQTVTSPQSGTSPDCPTTQTQKVDELLNRCPPPPHWRTPAKSTILGMLQASFFSLLCITAFGQSGLGHAWAAIRLQDEGDESVYVEMTRRLRDRLNSMLVVGSLLLATTAVLVTTNPPRVSIINYTLRGPYICLVAAAMILFEGIVVAGVCFLWATHLSSNFVENVLCARRINVYCTLIMVSYPFFCIGVGTIFMGLAGFVGIWIAQDGGLQVVSLIIGVGPVFMAVAMFAVLFIGV
ncbi:hypothetical protein MSAN_00881800 [Mycena sanguinolenta]|uniref:Transmembrane protein n=1 Tax=Mycena sanguinolenta TaxID=230812 RepID=A0A8H6YWT9_9AGAR|nr:hypothetical protein MSAN_00881800 [Mycena sanguinolenta]